MNGFFNAGDWLVVCLYLGAIVALGLWSGRRQCDTRDYFLGSRNVPWWGVGLSIVAAETSALTVIGVPSIAYGGNLMFLQMIMGYIVARLILAVVMVPHYLSGEIYSPYQLLEKHLGVGPRRLAGALFLLLETTAAGVRVYVACIPVRLMLGDRVAGLGGLVDPILGAILLFVGLALLYTVAGGVKAVIWTDAVQFGLFVAGGLFTLAYIPLRIPGGWTAAMAQAGAAGKLAWLNTSFTWSAPFNLWMGLLGGTALVLSTHGAEQLIVQRVLSCGHVADGRRALVLSAALIFPLFLIFLLTGVLLWVFYQSHPFLIPLPEGRPGLKANDFIYPIFIVSEAPHLLKGFLLVAILAAAMSSISSALTALASVSTMDFLHPALPGRSESFFLRLSRWSTIGWAVALIGVAWLSRHVEFVLNAAFSLRGLTSGALLGGLTAALFLRRLGARAVMAGMVSSLVVMNTLYWTPLLPATRAWWLATFGGEVFWPWFTLIGTLVTLGTAAAIQGFWPVRKP